ncbi:alpha/beta fold hydrolase [Bacteroidota bacterium]
MKDKQKLVLIPGMAGDKEFFRHIVEHLEDIADITVPVLARCKTREEMAEAVISSVEGDFTLAGTSMGGWVGFEVIRKVPERVKKFAAIATWARHIPYIEKDHKNILKKVEKGNYSEIINRFHEINQNPKKSEREVSLTAKKEGLKFINPRVVVNHMSAYLNDFDSVHLLPHIKCPVLVIAGKNDEVFNVEEHEFITKSIRGAKMAVINDCGHFIAKEQPQALSTLLRYWLRYF